MVIKENWNLIIKSYFKEKYIGNYNQQYYIKLNNLKVHFGTY